MTEVQNVKDILVAIDSVSRRAKSAMNAGDNKTYAELVFDLTALKSCLVIHSQQLVDEIDNKAA